MVFFIFISRFLFLIPLPFRLPLPALPFWCEFQPCLIKLPLRHGEHMIDKTPYTPGMREVLKLSKAEAGRLGHEYIGPEHLLLSIIRKGDGIAVQVLLNFGLDLNDLKLEIEKNVVVGEEPAFGLFSPIPQAREALE